MHRALQHADIFIQVLDQIVSSEKYLDSPPTGAVDKLVQSTLLSLALSCQSFTELALDELWRQIDDLGYLLKLLPSFKMSSHGIYVRLSFFSLVVDLMEIRQFFDGPILDFHWDLVDKYAKRIQKLTIGRITEMDPSIYYRIASRNKTLLPSLRDLSADVAGLELMVLVSPSLRRVSITANNGPFLAASIFINMLSAAATNLRHLVYLGSSITPHGLNSILKIKHLTDLRISQPLHTHVDNIFLSQLARMEHLVSLDLDNLVHFDTANNEHILGPFAVLRDLKLTSTLSQIISLLELGKFGTLKTLTLVFSHSEGQTPAKEASHWKRFFRVLRRNTPRVTELSLSPNPDQPLPKPSLAPIWRGLSAGTVCDLLALKLTKVEFNYCLFDSLSVQDFKLFENCWPDIAELHLTTRALGDVSEHALAVSRDVYISSRNSPSNAERRCTGFEQPIISFLGNLGSLDFNLVKRFSNNYLLSPWQ